MKPVRTRIAPSPTGYPHLALIYQAIFDYVLAHKYDGKFVLRIEDTDRKRYVEGSEQVIYDSLAWVNLLPDESPAKGGEYGPYRQSERLPLYHKYSDQLIASDHAYRCFCTKERLETMRKEQETKHQAPMYDKTCRNLSEEVIQKNLADNMQFTIRMKIPENQTITVHDALVGEVTFDSNQIDDQVIFKSDGFPTYHLAVVVDDYLMKISHVFRGTEWLPSLPKHILLWKYLGWEEFMPMYIHIPVLLNSEGGGKLSKRHGHTAVTYYQEEGFLPEAVVNYLANIVWNHPEGKEIFPLMDFAQALELEPFHFAIKPNGVHFDLQKLTWMNGEYIRMKTNQELKQILIAYFKMQKNNVMLVYLENNDNDFIDKVLELAKTRMKTLKDFTKLFLPLKTFDPSLVHISYAEEDKVFAQDLRKALEKVAKWDEASVLEAMRTTLKEHKAKGSVLYKVLLGEEKGLPLPESLVHFIGKEEALRRLAQIS